MKFSLFMFEICYTLLSISCIFIFSTDKYCIVEPSEDWIQPMKHFIMAIGCCWYPSYICITVPFIASSILFESGNSVNSIYQRSIQQVCRELSFSFSNIFNINTTTEQVNFNYSLKNIPLLTKDKYRKNIHINWKVLLKGLDAKHSFWKQKGIHKWNNNQFWFQVF